MRLEDIEKTLNDFSLQLNLVNQTLDNCKKVVHDLTKKDNGNLGKIGGFEPNELTYEFHGQTLIFNTPRWGIPFIRTAVNIYAIDKKFGKPEQVGMYELDTNSEGEHIDDWLDIHTTKDEIIKGVSLGRANSR